ncbi:hypothetical protein N7451_012741 [Penicillium sp. IBT 35674x]|nr:hypothetical protein N7451_012741 [Penicillium sp. IBT 35674x]
MDHPPSPSASQPAKRQRRLSEQPMDEIHVQDFQQEAGHAVNALKDPMHSAGPLTTQLRQVLHSQADLAMPIVKLLDFYFGLWDSYVVKSADKIHLDEEQQELQESNEWLEVENDLLVQRCNEQALWMWSRERVLRELHAGIAAVLKVSESDFDIDLHAIWRESSGIPTPPPCLDTDHGYHDFDRRRHFVRNDAPPPLLVECFFHLGLDDAPGFHWTGPDPLALSTQPEDLFLHLSAFGLSEQIHWMEFRLTRLDQITGDMIGEHTFLCPEWKQSWAIYAEYVDRCLASSRKSPLHRGPPASDCLCGHAWSPCHTPVTRPFPL